MSDDTCQHVSCDDDADGVVVLVNGDEYALCEDHQNMEVDGTPVDGYEPNDSQKFSEGVYEQ
jgi:hypothetical protein